MGERPAVRCSERISSSVVTRFAWTHASLVILIGVGGRGVASSLSTEKCDTSRLLTKEAEVVVTLSQVTGSSRALTGAGSITGEFRAVKKISVSDATEVIGGRVWTDDLLIIPVCDIAVDRGECGELVCTCSAEEFLTASALGTWSRVPTDCEVVRGGGER